MTMFLLLAVAEQVSNTHESITQLGVGGILVVVVLREVFAFVKNKKNITTNGYQRKAACDEIVKRFDINFNSQEKRFDKVDSKLEEVKDLIRNTN